MAGCVGPLDERADASRDLDPEPAWEIVPHPFEHGELGSSDGPRRCAAAAHVDQRVIRSVHDERRDRHRI